MTATSNSSHLSAVPDAPSLTDALQADIHRVFNAQGETAKSLRNSPIADRIARLKRLKASLLAHRADIHAAAARDFKRPALETDFSELMPVLSDISDCCRNLKKWLKPRRVRPSAMLLGSSAWVRYEARGRSLIIAPWNYPITLTLGPLIPAIASGNTVIIKTSEMAPNFSCLIVKIIHDVFCEDEVAVFEGDASVASALLALPFDHCFFTGSPAIGKVVMRAAAQHLTSVTLELGGKSPVIIDSSADIDLAVRTLVWAKYINSGQTCIAPDHVYVHNTVRQHFVESFSRIANDWYGSDLTARHSLGRIINSRHTKRVKALLDDALAKGASLLYGGSCDTNDHFIGPTLLGNIPTDAAVMQEEIFGPLLPVISFDDTDTLVRAINAQPKPLALYIWSRDQRQIDRIIDNTSAGGTCINHIGAQFLHHNLPFGGVNHSGIGSYHGEWGIRAFSHERAIVRSRFMSARLFFPPHSPRLHKLVDFALKRL